MLISTAVTACGADLTKIDRTIAKEPAYRSKPKYCLLVFGPKAKTRVWLVHDRLESGGTEELSLSIDLGPVAESSTVFDHLEGLFASKRPDTCQITFSVFLLKAVESKARNIHLGRNSTLASTRGDMCLFEDGTFPAGAVLAHEIGHFLLGESAPSDGHHARVSNLMFKFQQADSGTNLDKDQCRTMNRHARNGSLLHPKCVLPPPPGR